MLLIIVFSLTLSGCWFNKKVPMDQINNEGVYNYRNEALNFSLDLPEEFIYYQTQSKEGAGYKDIEFFVPTSDTAYSQEVAGYAKPFLIRAYEEKTWESLGESVKEGFNELAKGSGRVYFVKFWREAPADWRSKWTEESATKITGSFKVN